jgi:hypothetical protein
VRDNVRRILTAYSEATSQDMAEGAVWYPAARELAFELAGEYVMGAGVIAALSPQVQWDRNISLARDAFADHFHGQVGDAIRKARLIMGGDDPDRVLPRGKKTWHFYHTILDPYTTEHVTIDRHAYCIATGIKSPPQHIGAPLYRSLTADYQYAARYIGRPVSEVQAVTWVHYRNKERSER